VGRFRYSYNTIVYLQEPFAQQVERLVRYGYDGIELIGEPDWYDLGEVKRRTQDAGLAVSSICSLFDPSRDLCHPDAAQRQAAMEYVRRIADMAAEVGAATILVTPTSWGKPSPLAPREQEWAWAVENIRKAGEYAASVGVDVTIEAWNRYETYFLNRLDQCVEILEATGLENAGVHGDVFHMNIEEVSIADAYRRAGKNLNHTHIADSNRAAPGTGHIDFRPIVKALHEIDYQGYVCFELLPATSDPFGLIRAGGAQEFLDRYTELAIKTLKQAEAEVLGTEAL
jgi:sugar phosphate isomerase/epimerase